jgi:hypothetical protein
MPFSAIERSEDDQKVVSSSNGRQEARLRESPFTLRKGNSGFLHYSMDNRVYIILKS